MTDQQSYPLSNLPATNAVAITPSDSVDLTYATRGIYVGVGGNIALVMVSGAVVTLIAVPQGVILPLRVKRINATNTAASSLVAIY